MQTIRELRKRHGWTQYELAMRLEVTPSTIYTWESGKHKPRVEQLQALARLFGVAMDQIALDAEGGKSP